LIEEGTVNSSRERDQSIERLLRQSLKTPQGGGVTDLCLDAETLAALLDGGLSGAALEMAESHLADCARCQSLVGALARVDSAVRAAEPRHSTRGWLAWVVPLTAAAAAVAVWVAVSHHTGAQLPQSTELQNQTAEMRAEQPTARDGRSQPPEGGSHGEGTLRPAESDAVAKKKTGVTNEAARDAASVEAYSRSKEQALSKSAPASESAAQAQAPPTAAAASTAATTSTAAIGATAVATPTAAAARTSAAAPTQLSVDRLDAMRSTARREVAGIEISSPDPMVRWRLAGSTLQRSTDGGTAWENQSAGTVAELTAGAAPSPLVCWVVGRGGVVLLSTDGRTWRRLAFPEATDLSAVRAQDARTASVSTADGRTFGTTNAGATWVSRPQGF
jgi:hypothetical protein